MRFAKYVGLQDVGDPMNSNEDVVAIGEHKDKITANEFRAMIIDAYNHPAAMDSYDVRRKPTDEGK